MKDMKEKVLKLIEEIIDNAPEIISDEDINDLRSSGQSIDYLVGRNTGVRMFINNINKIKDKYEKE